MSILVALLVGCAPPDGDAGPSEPAAEPASETPRTVRVAVFNVWELSAEKVDGDSAQLRAAAEVIQRVRPDVLLLAEIDVDPERNLAREFADRYLAVPQHADARAIDYPHVVYEPVNTGIPSGFDFSGDGDTDDPEDAWGFGRYPGQYGMAVLSKLPVDAGLHGAGALRSFRLLRWRDLPGHLMPDGQDGRPAWYTEDAAAAFRLSSKTHLDVPVALPDGRTLHLLASHPTPPVFDGDEDRNGRRNFDEIRLWAEYLDDDPADAAWLVDDQGNAGGLDAAASFVLLGDLNADPHNDEGPYGRPAIRQLLDHPRVQDPQPVGDGEPATDRAYGGSPRTRTSAYGRLDYVLPSRDLEITGSGVFVSAEDDPLRRLVEGDDRASDHFLVWVDVALEGDP